jgi:DNA-binding response OmpR family regulator
MKILLLEDDDYYSGSMKDFLESLDFEVDDFDNGQDALDAIFQNDYDLLLLDIMVPKISGHEVVKAVRENDMSVPIILVTSSTDIDDLSTGYETGCNDYIRKPFALKELKCRINQTINSFYFKTTKSTIKLKDGFIFDLEEHEIIKDDKHIKLTTFEQKIVHFLIKKQGTFASTNEIISNVWEDDFIEEADLRMHIKRIRGKTSKDFIINSRGIGYKIEKA